VAFRWTASDAWAAALGAFLNTAAFADAQFPGYTDPVLGARRANLVVPDGFAHTGPWWVLREPRSRAAREGANDVNPL
jgi:hypothetical protein